MPFASIKVAASQTNAVVVVVPAGYRIRVLDLSVSASALSTATGAITVRIGLAADHAAPDVLVDQLVAGRIHLRCWNYKDHMLGIVGEDLTYTSAAAADGTISVIYELLKDVTASP